MLLGAVWTQWFCCCAQRSSSRSGVNSMRCIAVPFAAAAGCARMKCARPNALLPVLPVLAGAGASRCGWRSALASSCECSSCRAARGWQRTCSGGSSAGGQLCYEGCAAAAAAAMRVAAMQQQQCRPLAQCTHTAWNTQEHTHKQLAIATHMRVRMHTTQVQQVHPGPPPGRLPLPAHAHVRAHGLLLARLLGPHQAEAGGGARHADRHIPEVGAISV